MDRIKVSDKFFKPYLSYEEVCKSIDVLAERMNGDFSKSEDIPVFLCVMNGSIMFAAELLKRLNFPLEVMSMKVSSYAGTQSTGQVKVVTGISGDISGRKVVVVEDIVDTGHTIVMLSQMLREKGALDVKICTMLLKPEIYKEDVKLDYVAREIPNDFIVGFGLDYNELGRNYKDIYVIDK